MNEAYETCKRCNKVAGCFFLIISSVDRDMITKTVTFSIVGDFGFSMSPRDVYYQFYKNAPEEVDGVKRPHSGEKSNKCSQCNNESSQAGQLRTQLKKCDFASSQAGNLRTLL